MAKYLLVLVFLLVSGPTVAAESMQQLIVQKKYAAAVQTGEQLLQQNPAQLTTRFLTAYANQMTGNTERAIELYEALIRDQPGLPEPRNNLAMIYLAKGDYDHASQLLVSAINTRISYAIAYANLSQVYKGIASEAYRRAVNQSSEPAKYIHDIELTPITWLDSLDAEETPQTVTLPAVATATAATQPAALSAAADEQPTASTAADGQTAAAAEPGTRQAAGAAQPGTANADGQLIESVRHWAEAWSSKDFGGYTAFYKPGYRDRFDSHAQWLEHRRSRILRPGEISVEVSDFSVSRRGDNRASVDFTQAFSSPTYSDRVVKRIDFERFGSEWKIASERVLSVL
jgi:tetratricopeptide (TPR) repeat protein